MSPAPSALLAVTYAAPGRLWILLVVAVLVAGYVAVQLRKPKYTVKFTNLELLQSVAPSRPGWKRHAAAVAFVAGLGVLVLALAMPQRRTKVPTNRATVILAIDTSLSMQATDVAPTRLAAAKDAAKLFLDQVPKDMNVGIVSFNGNAAVRVEPTKDRDAARQALDNLQLGERTAIGEAIFVSLDAIKTVPPAKDGAKVPARIVLMSDGATTSGRSNSSATAAAKKAGVPIDTIAFGTDHGTVNLPDSPLPVPVLVDRPALAAIASQAGGHAYTAASQGEISTVYKSIGKSIGYRTINKDISAEYELVAFGLLVIAGAMSVVWASRMP